MKRSYFGTDGIRGLANAAPMDAETALQVGMAAGAHFQKGDYRHRVIIGKDTRLSGYLLEPALTAGFAAVGVDVYLLGPVPTPAVAMLTKSLRGDLGVMLSASHNPYHDNGIKLFDAEGRKLSDDVEQAIEKLLKSDLSNYKAQSDALGRVKRLDDAAGRYVEFVKATFPKEMTLAGLKIVIDCANGAAYKLAPTILWELGAEVVSVGVEPNGFNINKQCGSTHPQLLQQEVLKHGADIGIALDGDADRLIVCDEQGEVVDGDQLLALIATEWKKRELLAGGGIVATVMSNMGLEHYLTKKKLKLHRANVGDRYVIEGMQKHGCNVGGEQSGHIIFSDFSTTGDGVMAALQVLASLVKSGKKASKCLQLFKPYPQILQNIRFKNKAAASKALGSAALKKTIRAQEKALGDAGRILVRPSGTEPLIRIMVEGKSQQQIEQVAEAIATVIKT